MSPELSVISIVIMSKAIIKVIISIFVVSILYLLSDEILLGLYCKTFYGLNLGVFFRVEHLIGASLG
jgi:hypothetical protein